jgi:hypothetical protein
MAPTPSKGVLGGLTGILNRVLSTFGQPLTQKFVAHVVSILLTGTAVALLPLGLSTELNAVIVLVAGLVAHWLAPHAPAA